MVYSHIIPTNEELSAHYANYDRNIEVSKLTSDVYELWLRDWMSQGFQTHYDFGCGLGALVSFASSKGMQSVGSEIDASVVEKLRKNGIPAFETEFIRSNSDTYDVVTIIEVIEHVPDPKEVLKLLASKLSASGIVYLTTPNFDSLNRRILKGRWRALWYPDHINIFQAKSISSIMSECGLKIVEIRTSGHILADTIPGVGTKKVFEQLLAVENQRKFFMHNSLTRILKQFLNILLDKLGMGDTMTVVAIKSI